MISTQNIKKILDKNMYSICKKITLRNMELHKRCNKERTILIWKIRILKIKTVLFYY